MEKLEEAILMQHQDGALNKDVHAQKEFKRLKEEFSLEKAIETGTCYGYTTEYLAELYDDVRTIEVVDKYLNIAKHNRLNALDNVKCTLGGSDKMMLQLLDGCDDKTFIFLDAHWEQKCPLKEELQAIADSGIEPVIAIHDFVVPNHPELGYDSIGEQKFTFEWLKEDFDAIYGEDNYNHHYNSLAVGAKRGIIYITPKN